MSLAPANPNQLTDLYDRACARLARMARTDTLYGGAKALVLAKRLERMRCNIPANEIVTDVYTSRDGNVGEWGAYKCPECGSVCRGTEAAYKCCAFDSEEALA
jgi:rubrerythrin